MLLNAKESADYLGMSVMTFWRARQLFPLEKERGFRRALYSTCRLDKWYKAMKDCQSRELAYKKKMPS